MAKIVQTTDERVLKAAKDFPKAEGLLKDLFPEVFPSVFKTGNIVDYKGGHSDGPFLVAGPTLSCILRGHYSTISSGDVNLISLNSGATYSTTSEKLYLIREKF